MSQPKPEESQSPPIPVSKGSRVRLVPFEGVVEEVSEVSLQAPPKTRCSRGRLQVATRYRIRLSDNRCVSLGRADFEVLPTPEDDGKEDPSP